MTHIIAKAGCQHCYGTGIRIGEATYNKERQAFAFTATVPCGCVVVSVVARQNPAPAVGGE